MCKLKKKEYASLNINKNLEFFRCPVCYAEFNSVSNGSFECVKGHNFDITKKGYVNFCNFNNNRFYNLELFKARDRISKIVFGKLSQFLNENVFRLLDTLEYKNIVDAGCGSGFFVSELQKSIKNYKDTCFFGFDISKDAIILSVDKSEAISWFVSDISNIPIKDKSCDLILNVFSLANYREFRRILKNDGFLLKLIPNNSYLKEVRSFLKLDKSEYSNQDTLNLISKKVKLIDIIDINYTVTDIIIEDFYDILRMTPLSFNFDFDRVSNLNSSFVDKVTIDAKLLIVKL